MELLEPWFANSDPRLVDELRREIAPGHVLEGMELVVVGKRRDRDDFLFAINDGSDRLAAVHLTWSKEREKIPSLPETRIFDPKLWLEYMEAAHAE